MKRAVCLLLISLLAAPAFASDFDEPNVIPLFLAGSSNWSMFKHDLSHSGFTTDVVKPPLTLKWTYDLGYDTETSPAISGNMLYAVTSGGRIMAFSGAQVMPVTTTIAATPTPAATPVLTTDAPTATRSAPGFEFSIIVLLITSAMMKLWRN